MKTSKLVYSEFFTQGDLEKAMGNKPVESMDREKAFIPSLQIQFIDHIVLPVYKLLKVKNYLLFCFCKICIKIKFGFRMLMKKCTNLIMPWQKIKIIG